MYWGRSLDASRYKHCTFCDLGSTRRHRCRLGFRRKGRIGFDGAAGIGERRAGIHRNGNAERLRDLLLRCSRLDGLLDVIGDTGVAPRRHSDSDADQLTRLRRQVIGLCAGRMQRLVPGERLRAQDAELPDVVKGLGEVALPIEGQV